MKREIYIRLLGEGSDVWRPVAADGISESVYRIKEAPIPGTESWEFQPGMVVKVERRGFADKKDGLFAIALVQR